MPIYEYRCKCGNEIEDIRPYKYRDDPGPECPECGRGTAYVPSSPKGQKYRHKAAWKNRNTNFKEV